MSAGFENCHLDLIAAPRMYASPGRPCLKGALLRAAKQRGNSGEILDRNLILHLGLECEFVSSDRDDIPTSTNFVYTETVKNVTISLDDHLLEKCREFARNQGKSFNELVRDLLRTTVDDRQTRLQDAWDFADRLHLRLDGPIPSREERNARV